MISKKQIIIFLSVVFIIIIGSILIKSAIDFSNLRNVTFKLSDIVSSIELYDGFEDHTGVGNKLGDFNKNNSSTKLTDGDYVIIPKGDNIDTSTIYIEVTQNTSQIDVTPGYSADYLAKKLSDEREAIENVIKKQYTGVIGGYTISKGLLLVDGSWYITVLIPIDYNRWENLGLNTPRVVLHKVSGEWTIAATPKLVFKYTDYPKIPKSVVKAANRYSS